MLIFFGIFFPDPDVFFPLAGEEISLEGYVLAEHAYSQANINFAALVVRHDKPGCANQAGYQEGGQQPG